MLFIDLKISILRTKLLRSGLLNLIQEGDVPSPYGLLHTCLCYSVPPHEIRLFRDIMPGKYCNIRVFYLKLMH